MAENAYAKEPRFQATEFDSDGSPEPVVRVSDGRSRRSKGVVLSKGHVFILWSAIAGMMVFVFIVGFHAGRNQGRQTLLEEVSREALRLPIPSPIAVKESKGQIEIASLEPKTKSGLSKPAVSETETKFDFSSSASLPSKDISKKAASPALNKKAKIDVITKPKSGWYVQLGAAKTDIAAQEIKKKFEDKGVKALIHQGKVRDKLYYQVISGPYRTRDSAVVGKNKTKKAKISQVEPFVRRF